MSTESKIKEEILQEFLQCPICLDSFNNPRSLPCLHVSCSDCLEACINGRDMFPCPICKADTEVPEDGVQGFPVAFHVNALQDFIRQCGPNSNKPLIPCHNYSFQTKHGSATVKCLDCNVYYCSICNNAHTLVAVAEHHETIPLSDLTQEHFQKVPQPPESFCTRHSTFPLNHYCKDTGCQIPVCEGCKITKHKLHECIDLEEVSTKCREENKKLLKKDFLAAEQALEKRKEEVGRTIKKIIKMFNRNDKFIHDRYVEINADLKDQKQRLICNSQRSRDEYVKDCLQQSKEIDTKLSSLRVTKAVIENMTNCSPDYAIVQQHKGLQNKAILALEEMTPPDLWINKTEVTSSGESVVDMKLEIKTHSHRTVKCLNTPVDNIVFFHDLHVVSHWNIENTPSDFLVVGTNARNAGKLKEKLQIMCPQAYRMVPMRRDGNDVLVITESLLYPLQHIKMLNINDDKCETIQLENSIYPYTLAVDRHNDVIFTDLATPIAIRKWTKDGVQTIFQNKDGNNVLGIPWYICVNINDDIIVSDFTKKYIIIFDAMGTVRKTYNHFTAGDHHNPQGICTDTEGNIYVCDINGHCIHRLDKMGVFLEKRLTQSDGLWNPTVVKYSNGTLIVGQGDGYVKYFKIQ